MVQFSPNGQKVVTASEDKTARIWDARTGVELTPPLEHPCGVGYVYFSPDGLRMLTGTWEPYWEMRIWDVQTGRPVSPAIPDVHRLRCPPFNRNGTQIVSTWHTNAVMVWDGLTGAPLIGPFKHDMHVWAAEFSPNGQQFVSAGHDGNVCIWNVPTNRSSDFAVKPPITTAKIEDGRAPQGPVHRLPHGKPLWLARFSPNGERVFTICNDMTIQLWDAATGRALTGPLTYADEDNLESYHEMVGPYRGERSAVFSSDSKMILMAFGDRPLLLDGMNSRILTEPLKHKIVRSAEFSKDNQRVVTASLEGSARIWGVRAGWPSSLSADHRNQRELPGLTPVPSWVPTLLEAIAEKRLNERGEIEPASPEILFSLKTQLIESTASDVWTRWGKWLFSGSATTNATAQKPVE